jgi:hypothetical protein
MSGANGRRTIVTISSTILDSVSFKLHAPISLSMNAQHLPELSLA